MARGFLEVRFHFAPQRTYVVIAEPDAEMRAWLDEEDQRAWAIAPLPAMRTQLMVAIEAASRGTIHFDRTIDYPDMDEAIQHLRATLAREIPGEEFNFRQVEATRAPER